MGGLIHAEPGKDFLDIRAPDEQLVVEDRDHVPVRKDSEIRVLYGRMQASKLLLIVFENDGVLHREQPVVDPLRNSSMAHSVMHEATSHVDFPYRAACPGDHFCGENRPYSDLLAYGEQ
jgi:hypothetical protein